MASVLRAPRVRPRAVRLVPKAAGAPTACFCAWPTVAWPNSLRHESAWLKASATFTNGSSSLVSLIFDTCPREIRAGPMRRRCARLRPRGAVCDVASAVLMREAIPHTVKRSLHVAVWLPGT